MKTPSSLAKLLGLLALEPRENDTFLGHAGPGKGRLFGGLVASQSVVAVAATVPPERPLHSLHGYFLRPGRFDLPIRFAVDRLRDGRSFTTRRVVAHQDGEAIFNLSASFARPEQGVSHEDPMPEAPPPEEAEDWEVGRSRVLRTPPRRRLPIELRTCDPHDPNPDPKRPARQRVWMRLREPLPEDADPVLHTALLVYASDRALLSVISRPYGTHWARGMGASLDHAMWIHRPVRFEGWLLYAQTSPVAHAARGLAQGAIHDRHGHRVATVAQEGLIRLGDGP